MNKTLKIILICAIVVLLTGTTAFAAVHFSNAQKEEETTESTTQTTTQAITEKDYLIAEQADFDLFENMINKTSWVWLLNDSLDTDKISVSELIENYIVLNSVPCGMYMNFYDLADENYIDVTDPKGKFAMSYKLNADNVDWVIENVFNIKPDRDISSDSFYYDDNYLFRSLDLGGGLDNVYEIKATKELENGQYGFTVFTHENIEDWSKESESTIYFVATLKDDKNIGHYWAISKYSGDSSIIGENNSTSTKADIYNAYLEKINEAYDKIKSENPNDDIVIEYSPTYMLYDIDNNGIKELIINTGTNEANIAYEFYTYDNGLVNLGNIPCGHSRLAVPDDNNGLYLKYGHMDISNLYHLTLENREVRKQTIYENKDYEYASQYKSTVLEEYHASDLTELDKLAD